MNFSDTLIWLIDFPVSNGYVMVFIAGFAITGCLVLALRRTGPSDKLAAVRQREGIANTERPRPAFATVVGRIRRPLFLALTVLMLASLVLGILGLSGMPVTRAYIYDNGVPTVGTVDGDWVTFSTAVGEEYTLPHRFFIPSLYPDQDAFLPSDEPVVVRYLPSHPQAYVIDSSQLP